MTGQRRDFDDLVDDAYQQSVKSLYPHLSIAILGPYEGDCFAFLTDIKRELHKYGFTGAKLSTDRGSTPPDDPTPAELAQFYREEANACMDDADVGLFVFLDHSFDRDYLSDEALEAAHEPDMAPREVNISVSNEIEYWINNYPRERSMMIVEKSIKPDLGSRIKGLELESTHWEDIDDHDIQQACIEAKNRCRDWVMGDLREELWERYRISTDGIV